MDSSQDRRPLFGHPCTMKRELRVIFYHILVTCVRSTNTNGKNEKDVWVKVAIALHSRDDLRKERREGVRGKVLRHAQENQEVRCALVVIYEFPSIHVC
jgi:hypothetical protein